MFTYTLLVFFLLFFIIKFVFLLFLFLFFYLSLKFSQQKRKSIRNVSWWFPTVSGTVCNTTSRQEGFPCCIKAAILWFVEVACFSTLFPNIEECKWDLNNFFSHLIFLTVCLCLHEAARFMTFKANISTFPHISTFISTEN